MKIKIKQLKQIINEELNKLLQEIIDEETVKLNFPWKQWTLNKEYGKTIFDALKNKKRKLIFEPNGISPKHAKEDDGLGNWEPTSTIGGTEKYNYPAFRQSIISLDLDKQSFFIKTNLHDPRLVTILKSTIDVMPELSNFQVSKIHFVDDPNDIDEIHPDQIIQLENFGTVNQLLSSIKNIKQKTPVYQKDEEEINFEEFELEVFQELSEQEWYHSTRISHLDSILKKGLLPSKTFDQGTGWTQFNFNLQNAVYLTQNFAYAHQIAQTLSIRFEEDAVVLKISGNVFKNQYEKIVVDEDSLRDDYEQNVHYFQSNDSFKQNLNRLPEFIESVVDEIESIGFKSIIEPKHISVDETVKFERNDNE